MVPEVKKGQDVFDWIGENLDFLLEVAEPLEIDILGAEPTRMFDFKIAGESFRVKNGVSAEMMRSAFVSLKKKDLAAFREVLTSDPLDIPAGALL